MTVKNKSVKKCVFIVSCHFCEKDMCAWGASAVKHCGYTGTTMTCDDLNKSGCAGVILIHHFICDECWKIGKRLMQLCV